MKSIFKRFKKEYVITREQYELLMGFTEGKIVEDMNTDYKISSLYYDTENYDLVKSSVEDSVYKGRLLLRTYDKPGINSPAYIELKKKYEGVMYKRRYKTSLSNALAFLEEKSCTTTDDYARPEVKEITDFLNSYRLTPKALIINNRKAFHDAKDPDFRLTSDSNVLFKNLDGDPEESSICMPLIDPDNIVMEIKAPGTIPLWLSKLMSELEIYPESLSKYELAYKTYICNTGFQINDELGVGISA